MPKSSLRVPVDFFSTLSTAHTITRTVNQIKASAMACSMREMRRRMLIHAGDPYDIRHEIASSVPQLCSWAKPLITFRPVGA